VRTKDDLVVDLCKCKPRYDLTDTCINVNYIGPFVGFRTSTDYGKTWQGDSSSSKALKVVNVSDFGAVPDDGSYDTPALHKALDGKL
jgi:hypothetical protein